jgi:hypothetical protein
MARLCFYCNVRRARTDEHIFGTQFIKVLAEDPRGFELPTTTQVATKGGPIIRSMMGRFTRKGSPTAEFTTKVCDDCNCGWMSRVDDRAAPVVAPMIRGAKTTIDVAQRELLAAWAIKTALSGRSVTDPPQVIERDWTDELRRTELPIEGWQVWISVYRGNLPYFFKSDAPRILGAELTDSGVRGRGVVKEYSVQASFTIGYLAAQIFGGAGDGVLGVGANPHAILTVWPNDGRPIDWPPKLSITDETLWDWVERLNGRLPPEATK